MELLITARSKNQDNTDYLALSENGLAAAAENCGGSGKADDPERVTLKIKNNAAETFSGVIHIELPFKSAASKCDPQFFLPAFMYGTNRGDAPLNVPCEWPRLRKGNPQRPASTFEMVRSDRLSHPVALAINDGKVYGISASPYFIVKDSKKQQWMPNETGDFYNFCGFTCNVEKGTVGYTLGYENAPYLFVNAYNIYPRAKLDENCFLIKPQETVEVSLFIYEYKAVDETAVNSAIRDTYYRFHENPRKKSDVKTAVSDMTTAVSNDAWIEKDKFYSGQVFEDAKTGAYRCNKIYSSSWISGVYVATPQLLASLRLGDEKMRKEALECIENIIKTSVNKETGLPFDALNDGVWSNNGWWFDRLPVAGHSSYLCGQTLFYILRAYEYELKLKNTEHPEMLEFVKNVLEKIKPTRNTENEFPYIFSEKSGAGVEYDSMSGAWCLATFVYYVYLSGDKSDLDELKATEQHYYDKFVRHMVCYGAPLDTCKAVDNEGIIAYIKAVKYLHELSGDDTLLDHMKDAILYEASFKFCYNTKIQVPPLSKLGWTSCGGSVTSVANPHIHPMSSNIVGELLYYVEKTGDSYIRDILNDTVGWGLQTYNTFDKEYDYGKKGWMSERFCYSQGLVTEKYPDGSPSSTWFCLMPWAIASIVDGLCGEYWDTLFK